MKSKIQILKSRFPQHLNNFNFQLLNQLPGMIAFFRWSILRATIIVQPGADLRIIRTNLSEGGVLLQQGLYGLDMIRKFSGNMIAHHPACCRWR